MHSFCSSHVPNFKVDRFPKSKYDVGGGLCKVPDLKKSIKKAKGACSCDIGTYMLHMCDQLPHGATKFQRRLKAQHDVSKNFTPSICIDRCSTEEMNISASEASRNIGGCDKCQSEKVEESCAEFLNIVQDAVLDTVEKCMRSILKSSLGKLEQKVDAICTQVTSNGACMTEITKDFTQQMNNMTLKNDVRFKCLCEFLFEHVGKNAPEENENDSCEELVNEENKYEKECETETKRKKKPSKMCICKHIKTEFVDVVPTISAKKILPMSTLHSKQNAALKNQMAVSSQQNSNIQGNTRVHRSRSVESANKLKERLQKAKENRCSRDNNPINSMSNDKEHITSKCCCSNNTQVTDKSSSLCLCPKNFKLNDNKKIRKTSPSNDFVTDATPSCGCCNANKNSSSGKVPCSEYSATICACKDSESRSSFNRSIKFNASVSTCCQRNNNNEIHADFEQFCICKPFENEKRSKGGCSNNIYDTKKLTDSQNMRLEHLKKKKSVLTSNTSQDKTEDLLCFYVRERERKQKRLTSAYYTPFLQSNDNDNIDFTPASNRLNESGDEQSSVLISSANAKPEQISPE